MGYMGFEPTRIFFYKDRSLRTPVKVVDTPKVTESLLKKVILSQKKQLSYRVKSYFLFPAFANITENDIEQIFTLKKEHPWSNDKSLFSDYSLLPNKSLGEMVQTVAYKQKTWDESLFFSCYAMSEFLCDTNFSEEETYGDFVEKNAGKLLSIYNSGQWKIDKTLKEFFYNMKDFSLLIISNISNPKTREKVESLTRENILTLIDNYDSKVFFPTRKDSEARLDTILKGENSRAISKTDLSKRMIRIFSRSILENDSWELKEFELFEWLLPRFRFAMDPAQVSSTKPFINDVDTFLKFLEDHSDCFFPNQILNLMRVLNERTLAVRNSSLKELVELFLEIVKSNSSESIAFFGFISELVTMNLLNPNHVAAYWHNPSNPSVQELRKAWNDEDISFEMPPGILVSIIAMPRR